MVKRYDGKGPEPEYFWNGIFFLIGCIIAFSIITIIISIIKAIIK